MNLALLTSKVTRPLYVSLLSRAIAVSGSEDDAGRFRGTVSAGLLPGKSVERYERETGPGILSANRPIISANRKTSLSDSGGGPSVTLQVM